MTVGAPNDKYEQEADQVADQVVQRLAQPEAASPAIDNKANTTTETVGVQRSIASPTPVPAARHIQRQEAPELEMQAEETEEESIQRKPIFDSPGVGEESIQRKCAACAAEEEGMVQRMESPNEEETPALQAKCATCEAEEGIQPKRAVGSLQLPTNNPPALQRSGDGSLTTSDDFSSRLQRSKGGGSPMDSGTRSSMEGAMGADFSGVRVHTGSEAAGLSNDIGAQAFTHGSDVYFGDGKYDPGSSSGQHLLAHELTHVGQQGGGAIKKQEASTNETPRELSKIIHGAFHDHWYEDEEKALDQIRRKSLGVLSKIRDWYQKDFGLVLEIDFRKYVTSGQFKEAQAILLPVIPLTARINIYIYDYSKNEGAVLDEIKNASQEEIINLRAAENFNVILNQIRNLLDYKKFYEAWKILEPNRNYYRLVWFLENASDSDPELAYTIVLDTERKLRKLIWQNKKAEIVEFLNEDISTLQPLFTGTESQSLKKAMEIATGDLYAYDGTYDDLVEKIVEKTKEYSDKQTHLENVIAEAEQELQNCYDVCSLENITSLKKELAEIGDIKSELLTPKYEYRRPDQGTLNLGFSILSGAGVMGPTLLSSDVLDKNNELKGDSFLGRLKGDVGEEEFKSYLKQMGTTNYNVAKQLILAAPNWFDDDDGAIWDAFVSIKDNELREKLYQDQQVQEALNDAYFSWNKEDLHDKIKDNYSIAKEKLLLAFDKVNTDEVEIVRIILELPEVDRNKFVEQKPPIYKYLTSPAFMSKREISIIECAFECGKLPVETTTEWATSGFASEEMLELQYSKFDKTQRFHYRLGYYLLKGGKVTEKFASLDEQNKAKADTLFQLRHLFSLGLDEYESAVDQMLGAPTSIEVSTEEGRLIAAKILNSRVEEKGKIRDWFFISSWFVDLFSDTGGMSDQAQARFKQYYNLYQNGQISEPELYQLANLELEFSEKYDEHVDAVDAVAEVASTVAAIAVAIIVTVASGGTAAPVAGATLAEVIGSVSAEVVISTTLAAGITKVGTKALIGGGHYNTSLEEVGKDFTAGAVEGLMAAVSAPLAQMLTLKVLSIGKNGLKGAELTRKLTLGIIRGSESSLSTIGQKAVLGGMEMGIDGALSGVVGELVLTALDGETWEQSIWDTLLSFGDAIKRGLLLGGGTGVILGGAMKTFAATYNKLRAERLYTKLTRVGYATEEINNLTLGQVVLLDNIDEAITNGKWSKAEEGFSKLSQELPKEQISKLRKGLLSRIIPENEVKGVKNIIELPGGHSMKFLNDGRVIVCSERCTTLKVIKENFNDVIENNALLKNQLAEAADISNDTARLSRFDEIEESIRNHIGKQVDDLLKNTQFAINNKGYYKQLTEQILVDHRPLRELFTSKTGAELEEFLESYRLLRNRVLDYQHNVLFARPEALIALTKARKNSKLLALGATDDLLSKVRGFNVGGYDKTYVEVLEKIEELAEVLPASAVDADSFKKFLGNQGFGRGDGFYSRTSWVQADYLISNKNALSSADSITFESVARETLPNGNPNKSVMDIKIQIGLKSYNIETKAGNDFFKFTPTSGSNFSKQSYNMLAAAEDMNSVKVILNKEVLADLADPTKFNKAKENIIKAWTNWEDGAIFKNTKVQELFSSFFGKNLLDVDDLRKTLESNNDWFKAIFVKNKL